MLFDPRILILCGANTLLFYLTQLVNSSLAAWSLHLVLLGPMIVIPALYLHRNNFMICASLTGLWVDAALPTPFGLFTISFLCIGTFLLMTRVRFRTEHNYHLILLAHAINFICIVLITVAMSGDQLAFIGFWIQLLTTSLLSHLALLFIAPWFFNVERLLFEICRVDPEPEDLPFV
ncbi:hypothetical protein [Coraliomargarita parva]|uniref:hypothetical protein n=1 Tax=Coraliomargarita parva TaxID=3014050 RepID=UPI0022B538CC|nr:hypothetical protein [Coraliomargarita parva]